MDGYFPSELQGRFPDGVPFEVWDCLGAKCVKCAALLPAVIEFFLVGGGQVRDRRGEEFTLRRPWTKFPGEGQAVHGDEPGLCYKHDRTDTAETPRVLIFILMTFC